MLVVNCFQIVSLTYWSQPARHFPLPASGCELLSDCIFDILVTTRYVKAHGMDALWIAFRLYLWHIGHNLFSKKVLKEDVVNCFQIVSLTYWSQLKNMVLPRRIGCELLSDCIFDILVTTELFKRASEKLLWIAFRLYLWHIGHNIVCYNPDPKVVVNCFQIVSLTYWSQLCQHCFPCTRGCELLSDCIFDILVTT